MRRLACIVLAASAAMCSSCSLLFAVSDDAAGVRPPDAGATAVIEAGVPEAASDADASPAPVFACTQTGRGPELVAAGGRLCIDRTEVTFVHYDAFLDAGGAPQIARCTEINPSFAPRGARGGDDFPVHGVDWCDAKTFCSWAGKKLCGLLPDVDASALRAGDSGPDASFPNELNRDLVGERNANAWLWACRGGERALNYPYGNDYDPAACFPGGGGFVNPEMGPVGTRPCEGGFPGIFDMTGNVLEWVDACGDSDHCYAAGQSDCKSLLSLGPSAVDYYYLQSPPLAALGFRCCGQTAPFVVP